MSNVNFTALELRYLWKQRGNKNYIFKSALKHGDFAYGIVLEDIKNNRLVSGKLVRNPHEGESYHWPKLKHENIAPLIDIVSINENLSIYISLAFEKSLIQVIHSKEFIQNSNCIDRKKAYIKDILWGLDYIHGKRLCVMSISDENIFIQALSDKAMITDFSCLMCSEYATGNKMSFNKSFRPPELCNELIDITFEAIPAEIWSCGIMFFLVFTTHLIPLKPFDKAKDQAFQVIQLLNKELLQKANPSTYVGDSFVEDVKEFLSLFLHVKPENRTTAKNAANSSFLNRSHPRKNEEIGKLWACIDKKTYRNVTSHLNQAVQTSFFKTSLKNKADSFSGFHAGDETNYENNLNVNIPKSSFVSLVNKKSDSAKLFSDSTSNYQLVEGTTVKHKTNKFIAIEENIKNSISSNKKDGLSGLGENLYIKSPDTICFETTNTSTSVMPSYKLKRSFNFDANDVKPNVLLPVEFLQDESEDFMRQLYKQECQRQSKTVIEKSRDNFENSSNRVNETWNRSQFSNYIPLFNKLAFNKKNFAENSEYNPFHHTVTTIHSAEKGIQTDEKSGENFENSSNMMSERWNGSRFSNYIPFSNKLAFNKKNVTENCEYNPFLQTVTTIHCGEKGIQTDVSLSPHKNNDFRLFADVSKTQENNLTYNIKKEVQKSQSESNYPEAFSCLFSSSPNFTQKYSQENKTGKQMTYKSDSTKDQLNSETKMSSSMLDFPVNLNKKTETDWKKKGQYFRVDYTNEKIIPLLKSKSKTSSPSNTILTNIPSLNNENMNEFKNSVALKPTISKNNLDLSFLESYITSPQNRLANDDSLKNDGSTKDLKRERKPCTSDLISPNHALKTDMHSTKLTKTRSEMNNAANESFSHQMNYLYTLRDERSEKNKKEGKEIIKNISPAANVNLIDFNESSLIKKDYFLKPIKQNKRGKKYNKRFYRICFGYKSAKKGKKEEQFENTFCLTEA